MDCTESPLHCLGRDLYQRYFSDHKCKQRSLSDVKSVARSSWYINLLLINLNALRSIDRVNSTLNVLATIWIEIYCLLCSERWYAREKEKTIGTIYGHMRTIFEIGSRISYASKNCRCFFNLCDASSTLWQLHHEQQQQQLHGSYWCESKNKTNHTVRTPHDRNSKRVNYIHQKWKIGNW